MCRIVSTLRVLQVHLYKTEEVQTTSCAPAMTRRLWMGVAAQGCFSLSLFQRKRPDMLVLRRKVGESIILDGVISVSVLAVEGERVKIGITAPTEVSIVREELLKNAPDLPRQNAPATR